MPSLDNIIVFEASDAVRAQRLKCRGNFQMLWYDAHDDFTSFKGTLVTTYGSQKICCVRNEFDGEIRCAASKIIDWLHRSDQITKIRDDGI